MENAIASFDFGTTSMACVVEGLESKKRYYSATVQTNAYINFDAPQRKEQDILLINHIFRAEIARIFQLRDIIVSGICFTGQMHGIVGLDKNMEPVTNLVSWEDRYAAAQKIGNQTVLEYIRNRRPDLPVAPAYGLCTLTKWLKVDKRIDIEHITTLPDYFRMTLSETPTVCTDPSMAQSIGVFSFQHTDWNREAITALELPIRLFPPIKASASPTASLKPELLPVWYPKEHKVLLFNTLGDNQASFTAVTNAQTRILYINVGTSAQLCYAFPATDYTWLKQKADGFDSEIRPLNQHNHLFSINLLAGGNGYRCLFDFFRQVGVQLLGIKEDAVNPELLWKNMESAAQAADDSCPQTEPLFSGLRSNPAISGKISGITLSNFSPANLIKSFLQGLADLFTSFFTPAEIAGFDQIMGGGNALRNNRFFLQLLEQRFGRSIEFSDLPEEAATGAIVSCKRYTHIEQTIH